MLKILAINNLTAVFETFEQKITALDSITLNLYEGEMLGVVGGAGSGKSVLLKSIINLLPYPGKIVQGEIIYKGDDLLKKPDEELRTIRGNDISLILPNPRVALDPLQKIGDILANAVVSHSDTNHEQARDMAYEMLRKVGIPDPERRLSAYPHELSGGMCQRIVIGIALINSPKVLLADEISSGLDVTVQRQILDLLASLIHDFHSSTMIVTRDFGVVANYCNRIAVMFKGKIVEIDDVNFFFDRAIHPVSIKLLTSTFAAKGKRRLSALESQNQFNIDDIENIGELIEVSPGHYVREAK